MENLRVGDWAMIVIYSLLMIAIGVYCIRFARQGENYFAGGRRIPWWLSGVSAWMGAFSAYVFVGMASVIYRVGAAPLLHLLFAMAFAWFVGSFLWAARWRRTGIVTVPEFMEQRFNLTTRQVFAWIVVPFRIADDGVKGYATAKIIGFVFGVPLWASILGLSLITILYTMIGGLWAVMITDMVQFVILLLVMIVVVPIGLAKIGWLEGLVQGAPEHFHRLIHAPEAFGGEFTLAYLAAMWVMHPFLYNGSFTLVQRYTTVPTPRDAVKSARLSMALSLAFFPLLVLPPMISRVLYGDSLMASTALQETSYIKLCVDLLPMGMIGVVVVAIMAATMSTLSADFNIYGAVLTNDFYHRLINRRASQRNLALVGKLCTLLVGALALWWRCCAALGGAFDVMMTILGLIGGPTTIPILMGIWMRRPTPAAAIASVSAGIAFGALAKWVLGLPFAWFVLGNIAVTIGVFLLMGLIWPARGELKRRMDHFSIRCWPGPPITGWSAVEQEQRAPSPFAIVGVILLVIGLALGVVGWLTAAAQAIRIDGMVAAVLLALGALLVWRGRSIARKVKVEVAEPDA